MLRNSDHDVTAHVAGDTYTVIHPESATRTPLLNEDPRVFNYETYYREVHEPVAVPVGLDEGQYPRCLDMPLRLAGEDEYRLPVEYEGLHDTLTALISIEHENNLNWQDYNTYLTVDYSEVRVDDQQRHGGLHVDGFQGERIIEKTKVTRNYVATTNGGTLFWPQRFIVADPARFNVFEGFDLQVDGEPLIADTCSFYFMDAYTVHESGFADHDGPRLFVRLTYDVKQFDRDGNTENPSVPVPWTPVKRHVWDDVESPHLTDIIDSSYFPVL